MSKRGRNDPCWCGSGKKFKRCHQNRAASLKEFKKTVHGWNKAVFHRGDCLHPLAEKGACSGTVIASHTLQRRRVLEAIAENGHVGHLDLEEDWSPQTPIRPHPVSVVKVGLSRASTFPGFCAAHDATTFSAIEQGTWEPEAYPLFLLSYRSICRELFHKQKRLEWLQLMKRWVEGSELLDPEEVGSFLDPQLHWTRIGLKQLKRTKTQYDRALIHDGTDEFQFYAIRTQPVPTVVVTGASLVEADFSGCLIQNVYDVGADSYCTYTSIPYKTGGLHLFGWIGKSEGPEYLVHSVSRIQKSDLANALIRYAFEFLENTFFSMSWWEGLDSEARSSLRRRCLSGATHQRSEDCLIDDGRFYDSWRLDQVYTNVPGLAAGRR